LKGRGFAVVEIRIRYVAYAGGGWGWRGDDVEDGLGEERCVAKIAEEDAKGVEGGSEMIAAGPKGLRVEVARGTVAG
jgi:hypothetical protein